MRSSSRTTTRRLMVAGRNGGRPWTRHWFMEASAVWSEHEFVPAARATRGLPTDRRLPGGGGGARVRQGHQRVRLLAVAAVHAPGGGARDHRRRVVQPRGRQRLRQPPAGDRAGRPVRGPVPRLRRAGLQPAPRARGPHRPCLLGPRPDLPRRAARRTARRDTASTSRRTASWSAPSRCRPCGPTPPASSPMASRPSPSTSASCCRARTSPSTCSC